MNKLYLASRYARQAELRNYAMMIRDKGYTIVSRWHDEEHKAQDDELRPGGRAEQFAMEDLADLRQADTILHFTEFPRTTSRGSDFVEFGLAMGLQKILIVIGPCPTPFHCIAGIHTFSEFMNFYKLLPRLCLASAS